MAKRSSVDVPTLSPRPCQARVRVDQRSEHAVLEPENGDLLAALLDDGVLVEGQRRKARQTVVREHADDVAGQRPG